MGIFLRCTMLSHSLPCEWRAQCPRQGREHRSHFGSSCHKPLLLTRRWRFFFLLFALLRLMPNRRWQNQGPPSVRCSECHDVGRCPSPSPSRLPARRLPEEVVSAVQGRVHKLERVLEVLGEDSRHEFQAKAAAQGVPVGVQLEQSLKFVERLEKRLRVLDEERAKEARLMEEAKQRVAHLRSELAAESPHHNPRTVPADYATGIGCQEFVWRDCSASGKIFAQSCRCEATNPSPNLFTGENCSG